MITIFDAIKFGENELKNYSDTSKLDAKVLLKDVLQKDELYIIINKDKKVKEEEFLSYIEKINLRKKHMPVAYIIGKKEFMGFEFKVTENTLIPRPDTEILVLESIDLIKENNYKKVLDLATGSGAIGISIAKILADTKVTLSDVSEKALDVAKENARILGANNIENFIHSDLFKSIKEKFDIIVSNPPYIDKNDMVELMPDVKNYEPTTALFGGEDGLDFYRDIIRESRYFLKENGPLVLEIGYNQGSEVKNIMKKNGYKDIKIIQDLSQKDRVVVGKYRPET